MLSSGRRIDRGAEAIDPRGFVPQRGQLETTRHKATSNARLWPVYFLLDSLGEMALPS